MRNLALQASMVVSFAGRMPLERSNWLALFGISTIPPAENALVQAELCCLVSMLRAIIQRLQIRDGCTLLDDGVGLGCKGTPLTCFCKMKALP